MHYFSVISLDWSVLLSLQSITCPLHWLWWHPHCSSLSLSWKCTIMASMTTIHSCRLGRANISYMALLGSLGCTNTLLQMRNVNSRSVKYHTFNLHVFLCCVVVSAASSWSSENGFGSGYQQQRLGIQLVHCTSATWRWMSSQHIHVHRLHVWNADNIIVPLS